MTIVDEMKPSLMVARALGFAPYSFAKNDLKRSPIAVCYSLILTVIYVFEMYNYIEEIEIPEWEQKLTKMRVLRTILVTMCLLLSCFSSLLGYRRFFRFVKEISEFDAIVNLNPTTRRCTVIEWTRSISMPIIHAAVVMITVYYDPVVSYWHISTRAISYIGLFSITCKYWCIIASLKRRYRHINSLILSDSSPKSIRVSSPKLREIWILHARLTDAAEEFNSMASMLMLIWICGVSVNIITRIYKLSSDTSAAMMYDAAMVVIIVLLLTYTLAACHFTAAEANEVANNLYHGNSKSIPENPDSQNETNKVANNLYHGSSKSIPENPDSQNETNKVANNLYDGSSKSILENPDSQNEESILIGQYFVLRRFRFTAGSGILTIDLPLLLTILGAITTYLGILIKPGSKSAARERGGL